eukprot:15471702-Alexandrium_andersonii.AAC.1
MAMATELCDRVASTNRPFRLQVSAGSLQACTKGHAVELHWGGRGPRRRAPKLQRAPESSGKKALEGPGEPWRAPESSGEPRRALERREGISPKQVETL